MRRERRRRRRTLLIQSTQTFQWERALLTRVFCQLLFPQNYSARSLAHDLFLGLPTNALSDVAASSSGRTMRAVGGAQGFLAASTSSIV